MARPIKQGLDYFPFVCHPDDKLELIEAEFGLSGLGALIKLFQRIYGEHGYYCNWNNEVRLLFLHKCALPKEGGVVDGVIKSALKHGLFCEELYGKYNILTSAGIQRRFFEAKRRCVCLEVNEDYLLLGRAYIEQRGNIIVSKNGEADGINSQIKQNKSKQHKISSDMRVRKTLCDIENIKNEMGIKYE